MNANNTKRLQNTWQVQRSSGTGKDLAATPRLLRNEHVARHRRVACAIQQGLIRFATGMPGLHQENLKVFGWVNPLKIPLWASAMYIMVFREKLKVVSSQKWELGVGGVCLYAKAGSAALLCPSKITAVDMTVSHLHPNSLAPPSR
jgi:hypothetical protein